MKKILKLTFYLIVLLTVLSFFEFFQPFRMISWSSLIFFMLATFFTGYYNMRSVEKPFFLNIFMAMIGVKFIFSLIFFMFYYLVTTRILGHPFNRWIVIPFLLLFIAFKAYETLLLVRSSKAASEAKR